MYGLPTNKQNRFNFLANRFRTDVFYVLLCFGWHTFMLPYSLRSAACARAPNEHGDHDNTTHINIMCCIYGRRRCRRRCYVCSIIFYIHFRWPVCRSDWMESNVNIICVCFIVYQIIIRYMLTKCNECIDVIIKYI